MTQTSVNSTSETRALYNAPRLAIELLPELFQRANVALRAPLVTELCAKFRDDPALRLDRFQAALIDPSLPQFGALIVFPPPSVASLTTRDAAELLLDSQRAPTQHGLICTSQTNGELAIFQFDASDEGTGADNPASNLSPTSKSNIERIGSHALAKAHTTSLLDFEVIPCPSQREVMPRDRFERALDRSVVHLDRFAAMKRDWFAALCGFLHQAENWDSDTKIRIDHCVATWVDLMVPSLARTLEMLEVDGSLVRQLKMIESREMVHPLRAVRVIDFNMVTMRSVYDRTNWIPSYPPSISELALFASADCILKKMASVQR